MSTQILMVKESPGAIAPRVHTLSVPGFGAGNAKLNDVMLGYISVIVTLLAKPAPTLVYVMVYIIVLPGTASSGPVFVISISGPLMTVVAVALRNTSVVPVI